MKRIIAFVLSIICLCGFAEAVNEEAERQIKIGG